MPDIEKEEAIALFQRGSASVELVRDWSPDALADLIASINWDDKATTEVRDALQALYEQRRLDEAHRKRVRRVWGLAVAAAVVAVVIFVLWQESG
jgi:hypothetical protein